MFHFTPLLPSSTSSSSLLILDGGVTVLIDLGWDTTTSHSALAALEKHVSTLSLVLLTHPRLEHIGAYAHACKHVVGFRNVPVYATTPVVNLGRTLLSDLYASSPAAAGVIPLENISGEASSDGSPNILFEAPSAEEIASYFAAIHQLKYSQPHQPLASPQSPPLGNLTITAYGAGHTLGGTIWHIQHNTESIVYAHSWNQGRENLLPGATLLTPGGQEIIEPLRRPTALVCDARGVEQQGGETLSRKARDERLVGLVRETIAQGGKVLIPTDSSARMLELAFLLNSAWREGHAGPHAETYRNARVYMAARSASDSVRYLQSMLEWVEDGVRAEAEAAMTRGKGQGVPDSPVDWRFVKVLERESGVRRVLGRGKACVMLASDASLEWGYARQAFRALAGDSRNLVVMTERSASGGGGLAQQLWDAYAASSGSTSGAMGAKVVNADGLTVSLREPSTASLSADETALYETYAARQRQLHSSLHGDNTATDPTAADALGDAEQEEESDSSDDDDDAAAGGDVDRQHQGRALNLSAQLTQSHKRHAGKAGAAGGGSGAAAQLSEAELGVNVLLLAAGEGRGAAVHDYDVREKRGREKVFPFVVRKARGDEFGEVVKPDEYLRAEERDSTADGLGDGTAGGAAEVGRKRKWGDGAASAGGKGGRGRDGRGAQGGNKRAKTEGGRGGPDDIDAAIARATGEANGTGAGRKEGEDSGSEEADEESDYEPEDAFPLGPRKLVLGEAQRLEVRCRIAHVDFCGLHDLRALQMIIPFFRPRKVILVSGTAAEVRALADECRRLLTGDEEGGATGAEVFTPGCGEEVDASVDTNAWTVLLSRSLVRRLTWQRVKGVEVVALTGRLLDAKTDESLPKEEGEEEEAVRKKKRKLLKGEEGLPEPDPADAKALAMPAPAGSLGSALPVLDLPTAFSATSSSLVPTVKATQPVHVGDTRLADLRRSLRALAHDAVFSGEGTLLVDGSVVVRKLPGGRVEIEMVAAGGRPGGGWESFRRVREEVGRGLAVVAGV